MKTPAWQRSEGKNTGRCIMARWKNSILLSFVAKMTYLLRFAQNVKITNLFLIFMFMEFARMVLQGIDHIANNVVGLKKEKTEQGQFIRQYYCLASKLAHHAK